MNKCFSRFNVSSDQSVKIPSNSLNDRLFNRLCIACDEYFNLSHRGALIVKRKSSDSFLQFVFNGFVKIAVTFGCYWILTEHFWCYHLRNPITIQTRQQKRKNHLAPSCDIFSPVSFHFYTHRIIFHRRASTFLSSPLI